MFTPEHLHVALNHVALIGLSVAIIPLMIGLIRKDRGALLSGLLIVLICGLSIPVVMETGEGAAGIQLDSAAAAFLESHASRADIAAVFVYIALALAAAGLLIMRFAPSYQYKVAALVLAACIICTALLVWTAEAGGQIRHPEFRPAPAAK
ncbi:MAG: hypothetical protein WC701_14835 [Kiritimatiellales bacterium]|jgi:hypothetical protein